MINLPVLQMDPDDMPYHFSELAMTQMLEPHKLNVITNSLKNTFNDCSYKYYLEYIRRLSPKMAPDYFVWGGFLHYALDHVERGDTIDAVQEKLRIMIENEATKRNLGQNDLNKYEAYVLTLPAVLDAYMLRYKEDAGRYETKVTETKFVLPLGNMDTPSREGEGWTFEGKIDKIVRDVHTGVSYVWDFKTPGATGDYFWARMPLDSQMIGYILATQRALGVQTTHAIYQVIQKPSEQKKPVDDPEHWAERVGNSYILNHKKLMERRIIPYHQWQIDEYFVELCQQAKVIAFHQREGIWIKHHPGNRIGGCPYFNICVNGEQPVYMQEFYERPINQYNNELT